MSNDSGVWENCAWLNLVWLITWRPQGNYRNTKYFWTDVQFGYRKAEISSHQSRALSAFLSPSRSRAHSHPKLLWFYFIEPPTDKDSWPRLLCCLILFFLCTCLPCLICSFISGVNGAEKVSWSCSWFKKPILWLDRLLHCAAGQGTHNMARGQRETRARPCLEKFGVAFDAKSKGPNLISWWCVTLNMEKSGLVWKMQNKMKHFQCLK